MLASAVQDVLGGQLPEERVIPNWEMGIRLWNGPFSKMVCCMSQSRKSTIAIRELLHKPHLLIRGLTHFPIWK
jgi:hypothetical protein